MITISQFRARKRKRSIKREFEEQQELNALANRSLFRQELDGLSEQASIYFRNFEIPGSPRRRYWLMPNETVDDLKDEYIECVLKNLSWFKAQIAKVEKDGMPND